MKYGFPHLICEKCGMMYVSPILAEQELEAFYHNSKVYDDLIKVMLKKSQRNFDRAKFENGIRLLSKKLGRKGRLLDIGCLAGHFIEIAQKEGWDCAGIELNKKALKICRKNGLKVIDKKLDKSIFPKSSFEAVTLWDVLEHITRPKELLQIINYILGSGGLLLILVPNSNSLAARILQKECNMFNGCQHINLFSEKPLKILLKDCGFEIIDVKTIISELSVLNNYLNYELPYHGSGKACDNFLNLFRAKNLHRRLLGYKLQFLAKKMGP